MKDQRLASYLDRMIVAAKRIGSYVEGVDRDAFGADQIRQDAVIANIMAIGECVTKILERFPDFAAERPDIEWRDIKNMRNRIAHQYFQLDVDTIWIAATRDVPVLLAAVEAIRNSD